MQSTHRITTNIHKYWKMINVQASVRSHVMACPPDMPSMHEALHSTASFFCICTYDSYLTKSLFRNVGSRLKCMERLKQYFADQGLTASDIPKAVLIHEIIGAAMAVGFWTLCFSVQPSRTFMRPVATALARNQRLEQLYSKAMLRAQTTVQQMSWLRNAPGVKRYDG